MLFASWHCNITNGQNQTTCASSLNTALGQNVKNPMTLFWKPGWFSVYKLVQKICWEPSTKIKSGRVTDHVQKTSAKAPVPKRDTLRWAKYRSERDLRERVSQKMRQTWQGRKKKTLTNTGAERIQRCIRSSGLWTASCGCARWPQGCCSDPLSLTHCIFSLL